MYFNNNLCMFVEYHALLKGFGRDDINAKNITVYNFFLFVLCARLSFPDNCIHYNCVNLYARAKK